jgi:hypothetical protein
MPLVVLIAVGDDDLSARLGYARASLTISISTLPSRARRTNSRTELGDEITSEKTRAAKDGRNVSCDCTAPSRSTRDDRWPVGQGEQIVHGALNPPKPRQRVSVGNLAGQGKENYTLPVGTATRGRRTNVAEARSMGAVRCVSLVVRAWVRCCPVVTVTLTPMLPCGIHVLLISLDL